ncbi:MAG: HD domain-containing protein [Muribaculaceae bacterium]|nr:HD domain-containing protein [Muribaculaceae bacterium]
MPGISDINWLYHKYYSDNPELRNILAKHSECVAKKALQINKDKKLGIERRDIYIAAMLHDIGVVKCNAPGIHAFGKLPYICHGIEGEKMLSEAGLEQYASICSSHTGTGITKEEVIKNQIPLPADRDYLPKTLLEKLICYSDKFFSKSNDLSREKELDEVRESMKKFGEPSLKRFDELHKLFS